MEQGSNARFPLCVAAVSFHGRRVGPLHTHSQHACCSTLFFCSTRFSLCGGSGRVPAFSALLIASCRRLTICQLRKIYRSGEITWIIENVENSRSVKILDRFDGPFFLQAQYVCICVFGDFSHFIGIHRDNLRIHRENLRVFHFGVFFEGVEAGQPTKLTHSPRALTYAY